LSRILAVDDEPQMRRALKANLTARGYDVDVVPDGETAIRVAGERPPDLVILDLGLPGMSGIEVIEALRSWSKVPILVLSARDADPDKISALDAGADDYVTKPFSIGELMARVRAALRRAVPGEPGQPVVTTADFSVDFAARTATARNETVHLTPIEWRIVENLVRNPGRLVSQRQLLQAVWGPAYSDETHYLRVHMTHVRRKLEPDPTQPKYFVTEAGMGYRYEPPLDEVDAG
jgi:two-component system, OmpR family, KDP operon response regulator KdpE